MPFNAMSIVIHSMALPLYGFYHYYHNAMSMVMYSMDIALHGAVI